MQNVMPLDAAAWLAALPSHRRDHAAEALGLASGYERRIFRMERAVAQLERETAESHGQSGVAFADVRDVHGVLLPPDTMQTLTNVVRSGLNNFATLLAGSIAVVHPRTYDREAELRLQALVVDAGVSIWTALDSGPLDHESMRQRAVAAVDALWQTHAVPAIHARRAQIAADLRTLRALVENTKSAARRAQARRAACARFGQGNPEEMVELIPLRERQLEASLDCASWHGLRVAAEGLPLVGPPSHAPLLSSEGDRAHLATAAVPAEGLLLPVVQMAHVLRTLVHRGFLKAEVLGAEVVCRLLRADALRYRKTLRTLHDDLEAGTAKLALLEEFGALISGSNQLSISQQSVSNHSAIS